MEPLAIVDAAARLAGLIVVSAIVFVPLEHWMTGGRRVRPPLAVDAANLGLLAIAALLSATAAALVAARWPAMFRVGATPDWPRFVASLALGELLSYAMHRAMHASPLLWRVHRVHHGEHVDWLAAWRMHPVDASLHVAATITPAILLQVPLAAHAAVSIARRLYTSFLHAQGAWRLTWLDRVVATPAFHHAHHDERAPAANFAALFPFLDVAFGTWRSARPRPAIADPVARAGAVLPGAVGRVHQVAALERETAAADALAQPALQPLQLGDARVER